MPTIITSNSGMTSNGDPNNPSSNPSFYPMTDFYPLFKRIHHHKKKKHKKRSHK